MSGTPTNPYIYYILGSDGSNFKIVSKSGGTLTDRLEISSVGNMTFNGNLNATSYIVGGTNILTITSNYTASTSNILVTRIQSEVITASNLLVSRIQSEVTSASNILVPRIQSEVITASNILVPRIQSEVTSASNLLVSRILFEDKSTSNILIPRIQFEVTSTSNILVDAIKNNKSSQWTTSNNNIYYNEGNVGIGTTNPLNKLEVWGVLKITANSAPTNDQLGVYIWNQTNVGPTIAGNSFEVRTGGDTPRMRINTSGNVGIGTTDPRYKCHIKAIYDNIASGIHLDASDGSLVDQYTLTMYPYVIGAAMVGWKFRTISQTGGTNTPMTFDNAGNVAISGTPNSSYKLNVEGTVNATSYLLGGVDILTKITETSNYITSTSNILVSRILSEDKITSNILIGRINDTSNYVTSTSNILVNRINSSSFWTTGPSANSIHYISGNVGIGTTNSANGIYSVLHIKGTDPILTIQGQGGTGAKSQINLSTYDTSTNASGCSLIAIDDGAYGSTFKINLKTTGANTNTQFTALEINNNGFTTIGYLTAGAFPTGVKLNVYGSDSNGWSAQFKHPNNTQGIAIQYDGITGTNSGQSMNLKVTGGGAININTDGTVRFQASNSGCSVTGTFSVSGTSALTGNVGIGTTSHATYKLDVNGTVNATSYYGSGANLSGLTASQIPSLDAGKITTGTFATSQIPNLATSNIINLDTALSGKQGTINSVANQLIIGNGNGSTITSPGLTFNTSTNTFATSNIAVYGDLTVANNLTVYGNTTRLETYIYTTENLEVVNTNINSVALMVQQSNSGTNDIFVASNQSTRVFNIANNGDVNISGIYKKNNRDVIQDTSNYVTSASNILVPRILSEVTSASNILVNRINSSTFWTAGSGSIYYNSGNVGIGTNNPRAKLDIATPDNIATATNLLDFRNISDYGIYATSISIASRGNTLDFLARDYNGGANNIRNVLSLRPEGNVGIGTNSPASILEVVNSSPIFILRDTGNGGGKIYFGNSGHGVGRGASVGTITDGNDVSLWTAGTGSIAFATTSTERMRIASNGNVGIGTNNPGNILQVGSGARLKIANNTDDFTMIGTNDTDGTTNARITLFGNTWPYGSANGNIQYTTTSTGKHIFFTGGADERMRIASNGAVSIGGTLSAGATTITGNSAVVGTLEVGAATAKLLISGNSIVAQGSDANIPLTLQTKGTSSFAINTDTTTRMTINSSGNVGIGTSSMTYSLEVSSRQPSGAGVTSFPLRITAGDLAVTNLGNNTATLIGLSTENGGGSSRIKCAIGHCRTDSSDRGSIVFLCNNVNDSNPVTMSDERMRITSTGNVGIGTNTRITNKLLVHQGSSGTGVTSFPLRISAGAYTSAGNGTATLIGLATQNDEYFEGIKCGIGHVRTGSYDVGSIVFLCNNTQDGTNATMSDERMRITSTGNVGIGTNNPTTAKLEVWGNLLMSSTNWVSGANVRILGLNTDKMIEFSFDNGTTIYDNNAIRFRTNGSERMLIASNGAVSIGGTLSAGATTITGNSAVVGTLEVGAATAELLISGNSIVAQGTDANIPLTLQTKGTSSFAINTGATPAARLSITDAGNVGIGTNTDINNKLIVHQGTTGETGATCFPLAISAGAYTNLGNGTATLIGLATYRHATSPWHKCAIGHCRTGTYDVGSIVFLCNNTNDATAVTMADERMRITSTGNVGIGTNNPGNILQVGGGGRLRIANDDSDYTMIGTRNINGTTNTQITMYGNTHPNASSPHPDYAGRMELMSTASGSIVFYTTNAQTERMRITSTGNVGIGTATVNYKLHVEGTLSAGATTITGNSVVVGTLEVGAATAELLISGNSIVAQGTDANIPLTLQTKGTSSFAINTGATTRMTINSSGNVGIGTNIAENNLHIYNATNSSLKLETTTTGTATVIFQRGTTTDLRTDYRIINDTDDILKFQYQDNLVNFGATGSDIMWIYDKRTEFVKDAYFPATVGIGMGMYPGTGALSVLGDTYMVGNLCINVPPGPSSYTLDVLGNVNIDGDIGIGANPTSGVKLYVSGTTQLGGSVGIGTAPPSSYALNVNGTINATGVLVNGSAISGSRWSVGVPANSICYTAGNVGIGNTAPIGPLCIGNASVASSDGFLVLGKRDAGSTSRQFKIGISDTTFEFAIGNFGVNNVAGTWVQQFKIANSAPVNSAIIDATGGLSVFGNITAYYSDERLKTKTANISDPLKIIDKLNGFYYKPNELAHSLGITNNKQDIGLSAQEVQSVLPELVNIAPFDLEKDKDGNKVSKSGENYLTLSYDRLAPVFVEAIKELNQKNISLTIENNELKEKYNKLLEDITLIKQTLKLV